MNSVKMPSSLCRSSPPKVAIIYTTAVRQQCVRECQKHNESKISQKKYNKVRILKYVTYSHIIYHVYYFKHHNQPAYCIHNVKTSYMLDFHKFFGTRKNAEKTRKTRGKRGKSRGKLRILKIFRGRVAMRTAPTRTRPVADADFKTRTRCVADADYLPTSIWRHYLLGKRSKILLSIIL